MDTTVSGGFDTLSAANALEKAGFNREQAEVLSHTMARAQGDLATKADVAAVKADVAALQVETKADLATLQAATKEDLAAVKSDVAAVKADVAALRREVSSLRTIMFGVFLPMLLANMGMTAAVLIHLLSD